ncbi:MAG: PDZ domain-containing protein [Lacunisphaera sp.]
MKVASALLALLCLAPASAKDKAPSPPPVDDKVVVLQPFEIKGKPIISFALDLRIYMDPATRKVERIFITRVWENTDAEHAGLQVGDEIVKVDGMSVRELDARVAADSPLGRIFLNRPPGEPLRLDVITRRTEKFILHSQRPMPDLSN